MRKSVFALAVIILFGSALSASADVLGGKKIFYIDSGYDISGRKEVEAILVKKSDRIYFYADVSWWNFVFQEEVLKSLDQLGREFDQTIYPNLISAYGDEPNPGIDGDPAITVLIHPMKKGSGGYFRSADEYSKILVSDSNQREMLYLNSEHITSLLAKSFLAHEFVHLITFNQKENKNNVVEEVWLNEMRAEYAPTFLGYDDIFENSNLENRLQNFAENPSESLTEWRGTKSNYGSINLFAQYIFGNYGLSLLSDSIRSEYVGIESIDYALKKNGFSETFSDVFTNWTITVLINDCAYGQKYCLSNPNLKDFHINPKISFLPMAGESTLTLSDIVQVWAGNWYKVIGGNGNLTFKFQSQEPVFKVPYIILSNSGNHRIGFLKQGEDLAVDNFGSEVRAFYLLPTAQSIENKKPFYSFSWTASNSKNQQGESELIEGLLAQIETLKNQIAQAQAKINAILGKSDYCDISSVRFGQSGEEVKCLQQFLKNQGVYPEGLTTGYFGPLTKKAVARFQEKYAAEILTPLGLVSGTGFVGPNTKAKIRELM
ncbi:MAG: hypothetical protein A2365_00435 [Candidatus Nealsonbacteria bacterium RIFOXYB1_FULL_40_15]|uniref:Peptidoglycan binding-like domain-containing protein n=2 Tax=Candidatus Nealsoniibacteriota TaxID=1817911 RepID=A0A1G2ES56_9BACT|nr:MAG: hypothetical protein A2365_00435 [Candidatus Nealsonbacteria bacterium RIFOXYB1_FULL_40_15]OGZ28180.1 MAG: hypothetical protein A2427_00705 [Candidatus Nealsonbacteria bacterium RIFOXYC1_FULL_40_7]OGZ29018.1 MAG: hypothetical protein A2562_00865 [Candidatus Nealsonbacteria bacterium RIFOXYD1_FULL_39_11]